MKWNPVSKQQVNKKQEQKTRKRSRFETVLNLSCSRELWEGTNLGLCFILCPTFGSQIHEKSICQWLFNHQHTGNTSASSVVTKLSAGFFFLPQGLWANLWFSCCSPVRISQPAQTCLNRGVRIEDERDKRQKIESGGYPVNTITASSLFLLAFIYPKPKGRAKGFLTNDTRKNKA